MTSARALANQKLYHAKILVNSWRTACLDEQVAHTALEQAFGPAICEHLAKAYGWFLLEIAQPAEMPLIPPGCCADLPAVAEGKETPPEVREFLQLERGGWLAQLLNPQFGQSGTGQDRRNLAIVSSAEVFSPEQAEHWLAQLNELFERMTHSLDEY